MNRGWKLRAARLVLALALGGLASYLSAQAPVKAEPIRLGWQVPWATQGQLVMGLKYTNIPELVGIELDFAGFSYGGPLNHAALSGQVDVLLTADQPALVLMSRSDDFLVVGRMMYNRVCIYVPPGSPITGLADLRGKTIMGPVGAAAERVALAAIASAGVGADEIEAGSLDIAQQSALVGQSGGGWGKVDALYGFDPFPAILEVKGLARMLDCGKVVSLVIARRNMVQERRAELEAFLRGFKLSWFYFAKNPERLNAWFAKESRLDVTSAMLDLAASIEPNRFADSLDAVRLDLSRDDLAVISSAHDFLRQRKIMKRDVEIPSRIELAPLNAALARGGLDTLFERIRPTGAPGAMPAGGSTKH